jgi:hypothetical protein
MRPVALIIAMFICTIMLTAPPIHSVAVSALNLDRVIADSDLIVVGNVTSVREGGTTSVTIESTNFIAHVITGVIHVDQLLKGAPFSGDLPFQFYVPEPYVGWKSVAPNTYAMFFFKIGASSVAEFTNPYYPTVPATLGFQARGTTATELVISILDGVMNSDMSSSTQKIEALDVINYSKSPASTKALRSALNHPDRKMRLGAAGALLERNDTSGLALVTEALSNPSSLPDGTEGGLLYGIGQGLTDPSAVPALKELLTSPRVEIRRAAASGLMRIGSRDGVAPLLPLLNDPDFEVRFYAVVGIAKAVHQPGWQPNMIDFTRDQDKYLNHWKEWGQTR